MSTRAPWIQPEIALIIHSFHRIASIINILSEKELVIYKDLCVVKQGINDDTKNTGSLQKSGPL